MERVVCLRCSPISQQQMASHAQGSPSSVAIWIPTPMQSETVGQKTMVEEAVSLVARKFDSDPKEQFLGRSTASAETETPELDALFLLGDLNYRLVYEPEKISMTEEDFKDAALMAWYIYNREGRQEFSKLDVLGQPDESPQELNFNPFHYGALTLPVNYGGVGMKCKSAISKLFANIQAQRQEVLQSFRKSRKVQDVRQYETDILR